MLCAAQLSFADEDDSPLGKHCCPVHFDTILASAKNCGASEKGNPLVGVIVTGAICGTSHPFWMFVKTGPTIISTLSNCVSSPYQDKAYPSAAAPAEAPWAQYGLSGCEEWKKSNMVAGRQAEANMSPPSSQGEVKANCAIENPASTYPENGPPPGSVPPVPLIDTMVPETPGVRPKVTPMSATSGQVTTAVEQAAWLANPAGQAVGFMFDTVPTVLGLT
jgi:hypothetical protein